MSRNLDFAGIDYALCGGLAVAIYAKPRATLDIDIMIDPAFGGLILLKSLRNNGQDRDDIEYLQGLEIED